MTLKLEVKKSRRISKNYSKYQAVDSFKSLLCLFILIGSFIGAKAQAPVADFSISVNTVCSPVVVQFKDQSSGNPNFWSWDLGNGQFSNMQNPTGTYTLPGKYSVMLFVRNADGTNTITKTDIIVVEPSPSIDFSVPTQISCLPAEIQFTDKSKANAGVLTEWYWDFGDGSTSTESNPVHSYSTLGFYNVQLRVKSSSGCSASAGKTNYIRVVSGVIADFDIDTSSACGAPFKIGFSNLSSGPGILTHEWDFGNGTTSTLENTTASFLSGGSFTVKLKTSSQYGCSNTALKTFSIYGITTDLQVPDTLCLNAPYTFSNTSSQPANSSRWEFGDGSSASGISLNKTYQQSGNFTIRLINSFTRCTDTLVKKLFVRTLPSFDFTLKDTTACQPTLNTKFDGFGIGINQWDWDFGDGSTGNGKTLSHNYTKLGSFNVKLKGTDANGCSNVIAKNGRIVIKKPTVSMLNPELEACLPAVYQPSAVTSAIDTIVGYKWDFGDGGSSTQKSPSYTYTKKGIYNVTVTVSSSGGCTASQSFTKAVHVGSDPVPDFSASPLTVCAADSVAFTDLSLQDDSTVWMFGDGGGSTLKNPKYVFTDTGYFEVTLLAINSGCKNRITKSMYIRVLPPISDFSFKSNCTKQSQVFFENNSVVDSSLGAVSYEWSFGDATRATDLQKNTDFTYPDPGNYIVRLVARNGACTDTSYKTIGVNLDVADFEFPSAKACRNDFITAVATKSSPNNIDSYLWSIDGGALTPGSSSLTTSFSTLGDHTVRLVIKNRNGCTDTMVKKSVIKITGPIARFATVMGYGVCVNGSLSFKDSSSFLAPPSKWSVDFGDGQTQEFSSSPFVHQYTTQGNFSARMKVTDMDGCSDISSSEVKMITKPVADFSAGLTTICPGVNNSFQNLSQGVNLKSSWDFGDGNTQQGTHPVHTYTGNDAYYNVSLTVTDTNGCTSSITKDSYIRVLKPKPAFNAENTASVCSPMETKFKFAGSDYVSHFWDFGDGNQSTLKNPNHFYNDYGDYTTKLYLKGYGGCLDSVIYTVSVFDVVKSTKIEMDPILSCNNLLVNFKLTAPNSLKLSFTPGDGGYDTTGQKLFQHFYKSIGYYYPSITLRDSSGCQASRGSDQTVRVMGAIPIFGQDKRNFCDSGTVAFSNSSIKNEPITSTVWEMGDGGISTDLEPTYKFTRPGTFVTKLTLTTRSGCVSSATDTVRVYATPYTRIKGDSTLCLNNALYMSSSLLRSDTAVRWFWNFGNGISSVSQNPAITYTNPGTYKISLQTTNKLGCSATNTHEVLVSPFPIITVKENPILPVGLSIPLPITYSKDVTTYKWSPSVGLSCTDCAVPVAKPIYNTTYQIEVANQYGCVSNSSIKVTVQCNEKNYFMPNTFSPNNDGNNDIFYPRSVGVSRVQTMKLFNRWGQLVYEKKDFYSNDASSGWNGTIQGQQAPMDTYVYYIELICENSKILPLKGNVTLIR